MSSKSRSASLLLEKPFRLAAEYPGRDGADALQRVRDRSRLLENLLLHEMAVRSKVCRRGGGLDGAHLPRHGPAGVVERAPAVFGDADDIALLEVRDPVGGACEGERIRCQEALVGADAHDERTAGPGSDDRAGLFSR
jgi:hypothetical protein